MAEATTLWRQAIGLILGLKSRNKRAFSTRRNLLFSAEAAVILTSVSFLYTNLKKKKKSWVPIRSESSTAFSRIIKIATTGQQNFTETLSAQPTDVIHPGWKTVHMLFELQ